MSRRCFLALLGFVVLLGLGFVQAQNQTDIDFAKARQLRQKVAKGEKLTPDENAYLEKAKQAFQKKGKNAKPPKAPSDLKPLSDMTADEKYKGEDGGLYGGGKNEPPEKHLQAALRQAKLIQPLDSAGKPSPSGKIVLISVGMSNTTLVFSTFVSMANSDPNRATSVIVVDGAQGGLEAQDWAQPDKIRKAGKRNPWDVLAQRLKQAGVAPQQVQAVWIKQARRNPSSLGEFPKHAQEMRGHMVVILNKLTERLPNLRIAYLSSRTYAGYAKTSLNPEPYAYESAFVVRWLIQDQIKGDAALNYDPAQGAVKSPLLLWGPYLWANGEKGRKAGDLVWKAEDFGPDGTHPGTSGRQKVANLLLRFLKNDPTAITWFVKK